MLKASRLKGGRGRYEKATGWLASGGKDHPLLASDEARIGFECTQWMIPAPKERIPIGGQMQHLGLDKSWVGKTLKGIVPKEAKL